MGIWHCDSRLTGAHLAVTLRLWGASAVRREITDACSISIRIVTSPDTIGHCGTACITEMPGGTTTSTGTSGVHKAPDQKTMQSPAIQGTWWSARAAAVGRSVVAKAANPWVVNFKGSLPVMMPVQQERRAPGTAIYGTVRLACIRGTAIQLQPAGTPWTPSTAYDW